MKNFHWHLVFVVAVFLIGFASLNFFFQEQNVNKLSGFQTVQPVMVRPTDAYTAYDNPLPSKYVVKPFEPQKPTPKLSGSSQDRLDAKKSFDSINAFIQKVSRVLNVLKQKGFDVSNVKREYDNLVRSLQPVLLLYNSGRYKEFNDRVTILKSELLRVKTLVEQAAKQSVVEKPAPTPTQAPIPTPTRSLATPAPAQKKSEFDILIENINEFSSSKQNQGLLFAIQNFGSQMTRAQFPIQTAQIKATYVSNSALADLLYNKFYKRFETTLSQQIVDNYKKSMNNAVTDYLLNVYRATNVPRSTLEMQNNDVDEAVRVFNNMRKLFGKQPINIASGGVPMPLPSPAPPIATKREETAYLGIQPDLPRSIDLSCNLDEQITNPLCIFTDCPYTTIKMERAGLPISQGVKSQISSSRKTCDTIYGPFAGLKISKLSSYRGRCEIYMPNYAPINRPGFGVKFSVDCKKTTTPEPPEPPISPPKPPTTPPVEPPIEPPVGPAPVDCDNDCSSAGLSSDETIDCEDGFEPSVSEKVIGECTCYDAKCVEIPPPGPTEPPIEPPVGPGTGPSLPSPPTPPPVEPPTEPPIEPPSPEPVDCDNDCSSAGLSSEEIIDCEEGFEPSISEKIIGECTCYDAKCVEIPPPGPTEPPIEPPVGPGTGPSPPSPPIPPPVEPPTEPPIKPPSPGPGVDEPKIVETPEEAEIREYLKDMDKVFNELKRLIELKERKDLLPKLEELRKLNLELKNLYDKKLIKEAYELLTTKIYPLGASIEEALSEETIPEQVDRLLKQLPLRIEKAKKVLEDLKRDKQDVTNANNLLNIVIKSVDEAKELVKNKKYDEADKKLNGAGSVGKSFENEVKRLIFRVYAGGESIF